MEQGDLDGALQAAQEAYRLDETNPYVMDTLGALYLRKGLADRAVSLLDQVIVEPHRRLSIEQIRHHKFFNGTVL